MVFSLSLVLIFSFSASVFNTWGKSIKLKMECNSRLQSFLSLTPCVLTLMPEETDITHWILKSKRGSTAFVRCNISWRPLAYTVSDKYFIGLKPELQTPHCVEEWFQPFLINLVFHDRAVLFWRDSLCARRHLPKDIWYNKCVEVCCGSQESSEGK